MRVMSAGHPCWRARVPPGQGAGTPAGCGGLDAQDSGMLLDAELLSCDHRVCFLALDSVQI